MKTRVVIIALWALLVLFSGCSTGKDFPVLKGPYLGQKPPGKKAEIFAPGIISTEDNDYIYGFFCDGTLVLFDRTPVDLEEWQPAIYRMESKNGAWTQPNDSAYKGEPWYQYYTSAPEGEVVYFSWKGSSADVNIWQVRKTSHGWAEPVELPFPVNSHGLDTYPSVTEEGTLYFFSDRENGFGGHDIYRSPLIKGKHTTAENLGMSINTQNDEVDPFIAPDESYIIFCSRSLDGFGGFDLFIAFLKSDGTWTEPVNMGNGINTSAFDWAPYVTPDGKYFFFNSMQNGNWDVYWVNAGIIEALKPDEIK